MGGWVDEWMGCLQLKLPSGFLGLIAPSSYLLSYARSLYCQLLIDILGCVDSFDVGAF